MAAYTPGTYLSWSSLERSYSKPNNILCQAIDQFVIKIARAFIKVCLILCNVYHDGSIHK